MATKVHNKKKNKKSKFYKIISFILLLFTVLSFGIIFYFNVFPTKYMILSGIILGLFILLIIHKLNVKTNLFTKIICILISIIFIFMETIGSIYAFGTIDFFNDIFDTGLRSEVYGIYVLNNSEYKNIKNLNNKTIGIKIDEDDKGISQALQKLNNKIKYEKIEYETITDAVKEIKENKSNAILINETLMNLYLDEHENNNIRKLDTIEITIKYNSDFNNVNVTKKPFALYISGVDTTGSVSKSSRSDVNILVFVNPVKGKILLLNTPRDYYLTLASKNAKDKLTHAGIYGIEESAKSLELLYDTEINYYVRVNFTSFIKIIDNLGGIKVDVEKPDFRYNGNYDCGIGYICEQNSKREWDSSAIYIKAGKNVSLNGEKALAYARNRHQYANGDNARGHHQEQIIKAVIEKASSPTLITNYKNILNNLSKGIITNIDQKTITKLINFELDNNPNWEIDTYNVKGKDSFNVCYSLGKSKAYVLEPDEESLNEAKNKIKEVIQ